MNYTTTTTFESKLAPGLVIKVRKRSQEQRAKLNDNSAGILTGIRDAARKIAPLQDEAKDAEEAAKLEPCSCLLHEHSPVLINAVAPELTAHLCNKCPCRSARYREGLLNSLADAREQYHNLRRDKYYPALIRWAVKEVSGIEIDGIPITLDTIFELPDEVVDEIGQEIDNLSSLTVAEQLGFKSPGTSSAPEAGLTEIVATVI